MRHNMCLGEDSETYLDHLIAATWNGLAEIELILDEPKYEAKRSGIIDPIWDTKRVGAMTYESFVAADSTQKEKLDENYDFIKVINSSKNEKIPFVELTEKEFIENYKPLMDDNSIKIFSTYKEAVENGGFINKNLWSLVQCPYEEMFIYPGYHSCNNIGYIVTEKEWKHENIQIDYNQNVSIEEAISHAVNFIKTRGYELNIIKLIFEIINIVDDCDKDKGYISIPRLYRATVDYIESITSGDLEDNVLDEIRMYYYE